jgi:hypothetical protein
MALYLARGFHSAPGSRTAGAREDLAALCDGLAQLLGKYGLDPREAAPEELRTTQVFINRATHHYIDRGYLALDCVTLADFMGLDHPRRTNYMRVCPEGNECATPHCARLHGVWDPEQEKRFCRANTGAKRDQVLLGSLACRDQLLDGECRQVGCRFRHFVTLREPLGVFNCMSLLFSYWNSPRRLNTVGLADPPVPLLRPPPGPLVSASGAAPAVSSSPSASAVATQTGVASVAAACATVRPAAAWAAGGPIRAAPAPPPPLRTRLASTARVDKTAGLGPDVGRAPPAGAEGLEFAAVGRAPPAKAAGLEFATEAGPDVGPLASRPPSDAEGLEWKQAARAARSRAARSALRAHAAEAKAAACAPSGHAWASPDSHGGGRASGGPDPSPQKIAEARMKARAPPSGRDPGAGASEVVAVSAIQYDFRGQPFSTQVFYSTTPQSPRLHAFAAPSGQKPHHQPTPAPP